jgi:hypothetical protein
MSSQTPNNEFNQRVREKLDSHRLIPAISEQFGFILLLVVQAAAATRVKIPEASRIKNYANLAHCDNVCQNPAVNEAIEAACTTVSITMVSV